jgi:hypothetical protein
MKNITRIAIIGGLALAGVATAGVLRAFPNTADWAADPGQTHNCGNGGIYATGSARDWGISCIHCHINDVNQQGMITANPTFVPALGAGNKYTPGTTYTVTVHMVGEHLGLADQANNRNGMTATFEDNNGAAVGAMAGDMTACAAGPNALPDGAIAGTTFVYGAGCHYVASLGKQGPGLTQWSFKWTVPAAQTGNVTMFYGVVDGNNDKKSLGDDVKIGKFVLAP